MKKILLTSLAALALTACVSDNDLNPVEGTRGYGKLLVSVSNDPTIQTRTGEEGSNNENEKEVEDISKWTIKATDTQSKEIKLNTASAVVPAETYTVKASNFASVDEALKENDNWGAAYYEGTHNNVQVTAGGIGEAKIDCGTAKNGRIKFNDDGITGGIIKQYSLKVTNANNTRSLTFKNNSEAGDDGNNLNNVAYFVENDVISWEFTYTYNNDTQSKTINSTENNKITISAATQHMFAVSTNDNGTLKIEITVNDKFVDKDGHTITIDAATGLESTTLKQTGD